MLLHFAAKLSSTSSFSPAPTSPTLRIPAGHSQPSTRAPAAIFFTQHITSWAAIAALPRACSPHRLVKINFYSINFFDGSALTLFNTRSCHIIRCAHHVKFNSLQSFLQPQTFEPTLRRQHFASLRDTRNPRLRVC